MASRLDIAIPPAMPDELAPQAISTSDPYIANRSVVEFRPQNDIEINVNESSTTTIEFVLSNPNAFIDNSDSYIELLLNVQLLNAASRYYNSALQTGGIHSCIRSMRFFDESGQLGDECAEYATLQAALSNLTDSPDYINSVAATWGDSLDARFEHDRGFVRQRLTGTATLTLSVSSGTFSSIAGVSSSTRFTQDCQVGDLLYLVPPSAVGVANTHSIGPLHVVAITSDTAMDVLCNNPASATGIAGGYLVKGSEIADTDIAASQSGRAYAGYHRDLNANTPISEEEQSTCVRLQFKPQLPFLRMSKYFPLRYMRACRLVIELNPSWMWTMGTTRCISGAKTHGIRIAKCRFVASLVQPVEEVLAAWDARYQSEQGIVYGYTSSYCNIQTCPPGTSVQQLIPLKVASARGVLSVLKNKNQLIRNDKDDFTIDGTDNAGGMSWAIDKFGDSISGGIVRYQYTIGSDRYPFRRMVKIEQSGLENLMHNYVCMGVDTKTGQVASRIKPSDVRQIHPTTSEYNKGQKWQTNPATKVSKRCYFTADFSKAGFLSGVNLRDADLMIQCERATDWPGGSNDLYFFHFVFYDVIAKINAMNSGMVKYF